MNNPPNARTTLDQIGEKDPKKNKQYIPTNKTAAETNERSDLISAEKASDYPEIVKIFTLRY